MFFICISYNINNIKLLILYGQSSEDLVVDVEENENIKKLIILNKNLS